MREFRSITEEALRAVGRAAAVVVDPNNGDILAMVSVPSFDPNTFIPSIKAKDWEALRKDEANPLVNRAISAFPPGLDLQARHCAGRFAEEAGQRTLQLQRRRQLRRPLFSMLDCARKAGSHGTLGLTDAIKVSCNSFFYQFGNAAGIDSIDETGKMLGLGQDIRIRI